LLLAYALLVNAPGKSIYSVGSCVTLVAALTAIQFGHLGYFLGGPEPLDRSYYRLALFVVPAAFYLSGRWAILPTEPFRPVQLTHLLPMGGLPQNPVGFRTPEFDASAVRRPSSVAIVRLMTSSIPRAPTDLRFQPIGSLLHLPS
jgi:hypothetical protein